MGTGIHGGFGNTIGAKAVASSPIFVGKGEGENLGVNAKNVIPEDGYLDVFIHGTEDNVQIMMGGHWEIIDHRRLANKIRHASDYDPKKDIRLISCSTGAKANGVAQNLANKLGVNVKAPSETAWVWWNGTITIGKKATSNTGHWIIFTPYKKGK